MERLDIGGTMDKMIVLRLIQVVLFSTLTASYVYRVCKSRDDWMRLVGLTTWAVNAIAFNLVRIAQEEHWLTPFANSIGDQWSIVIRIQGGIILLVYSLSAITRMRLEARLWNGGK
jgi:multisubunit Na+/H+ antiporter MnhF subunit